MIIVANRTPTHVIETKSRDKIRTIIDNYQNGDALFREISERDYGIDAVLELFHEGNPTGKFALLQLKATEKTIVPNKDNTFISVPGITLANANYALQNNIPVILIYTSITKNTAFYYSSLQDLITEEIVQKINNNLSNKTTVRIPIENCILDNIQPLINLIEEFYI